MSLYPALANDRRAVTAMEYAVIAGVLVLMIVTAFTSLGTALKTEMTTVAADITG